MRCPDCNKFVGLELQDPEINEEDFDETTGDITAEYRIVRVCADCGTELKEATIQFSEQVDGEFLEKHTGEGHSLTADFSAENLEIGGGRYQKAFFGIDLRVTATCSCGEAWEDNFSDQVAASEMDELA